MCSNSESLKQDNYFIKVHKENIVNYKTKKQDTNTKGIFFLKD